MGKIKELLLELMSNVLLNTKLLWVLPRGIIVHMEYITTEQYNEYVKYLNSNVGRRKIMWDVRFDGLTVNFRFMHKKDATLFILKYGHVTY